MPELKPLKLNGFEAGVNNRRPDFKLALGEGKAFLRAAVNADLTAEGTLKRRSGYALDMAGTACHSLWSDGTTGYCADGADLVRVTEGPDGLTKDVLHSGLFYGAPVSFCDVVGSTWYTDGARLRRIDAGVDRNAVVPMLSTDPVVTASMGGSLPAGDYQFSFTQFNDQFEESGATLSVQVSVPANGKVTITGLPGAFASDVVAVGIYMSALNGSVLMRAAVLFVASSTFEIAVMPSLGARCPTDMLAPMPAGRFIAYVNGRLFVAVGSILFYSEPFAPALRNPIRGYIPFAAPITMVQACDNGLYVASDLTYWFGGDIGAAEMRVALPYGAVPGTSGLTPDANACYWMSERGLVRGTNTGEATNLQEKNVAIEPAAIGASLFRERDGMKQALSSLFDTGPSVFAAYSYMDAEVVRKATQL